MTTEDRGTQFRVGIFILIGLTTVALMVVYFGRLGEGLSNYYNLRVEFANASGIIRGSEVLLAGAKVGRVVNEPEILPDMKGVFLEIRILEQVRIPVGSEFSIGSSGLLGDKYIQIVLKEEGPGGATIEPGSTIQGNDAGDGFGGLTTGAGDLITDLRSTVKNINAVVTKLDSTVLSKKELESLSSTIKNLETTSGKLAESSGRIDALLESGKTTMDSTGKAAEELHKTLEAFRELANQARTGKGLLGTLVSNKEMADNLRSFVLNLRKHGILWYKDTQKP
jgi:phospholipid/cholesterol/gamma-HCH transport system substrate-binding protein